MPSASSPKSANRNPDGHISLLDLPMDLQVNILTYLRAYDLSAVQMSCRFYARVELIDNVVSHFAENIYTSKWTLGFESPQSTTQKAKNTLTNKGAPKQEKEICTFAHLRNMELLVVARALNSPEPSSGFFVSKSWCKSALRWLESQQEHAQQPKKLSKKKQRVRDRKLSDVSPPWPNANIDLLCEHQNLQRCSNGKSGRARRRLLDRQAWKILKKLYPDSTQLESAVGECIQCTLECETVKRNEADKLERERIERQLPLADEDIRRFFKRRTGVPSQSIDSTASLGQCPLKHGKYYCVPRSWCYAWRHYIKTGEGGSSPPPDAASLLCHAHRLALLPPHLEAYLYGDSPDLLIPHNGDTLFCELVNTSGVAAPGAGAAVAAPPPPALVPGQGPDPETLEALRAAGFAAEVGQQIHMMRELEDIRAAAAPAAALPSSPLLSSRNEQLDWENYAVVEILTEKEYLALENSWAWKSGRGFGLRFGVDEKGATFHTTQTCRECDATGRSQRVHIRNRDRRAIRKSTDKGRAPASLEY